MKSNFIFFDSDLTLENITDEQLTILKSKVIQETERRTHIRIKQLVEQINPLLKELATLSNPPYFMTIDGDEFPVDIYDIIDMLNNSL